MQIKAKLLNSGASLNNFFEIDGLAFVPGEDVTIVLRVYDAQRDIRYIPPATAEMTLTFTKKDGTSLVKDADILDADDRSMWTVDLSQAETADLAGMNIVVTLDPAGDATVLQKTVIANALQRTNLSGDC